MGADQVPDQWHMDKSVGNSLKGPRVFGQYKFKTLEKPLYRALNGCDGADAPSYGVFFADTLKGQSAHEVNYPYLDLEPKLTCPAGLKTYNSGAYVSKALIDLATLEARGRVHFRCADRSGKKLSFR